MSGDVHGGAADGELAAWAQALRAGAVQAPRCVRLPLWAGDARIGSVEPGYLEGLDAPVRRETRDGTDGWAVQGEPGPALHRLALALRAAGRAHAWRDEQLGVPDETGRRIATVERAVVRGLGIQTYAVHLVGTAPDGRHWLQQRALTKANDPGLWDTLMGGMVSATDSLEQALARETWEEAGLRVEALQGVAWGGRIAFRRPSTDCAGAGFVAEDIDWFRCTVPEGVVPANQDGEVERFELVEPSELATRLRRGEFTLEAALILAHAIGLAPASD